MNDDYEAALGRAMAYQNELTRRLIRKDKLIKELRCKMARLQAGDDVITQATGVVERYLSNDL